MTCEGALEKAIACLKQYASEDDDARIDLIGIIFEQLMKKSPIENYWEFDKE